MGIPRKVTKNDDIVVNFDRSGLELHIFCDTSESAYGFSIYARTPSATKGASSLLTAESRLAPKKLQTLPRLELCAVNIASKTTKVILEVLGKLGLYPRLYAYSDSTIALSWVKSQPYRFQTFVANRVVMIQQVLPPEIWYHVPTKQNPADLATRPHRFQTSFGHVPLVARPQLAELFWALSTPWLTRYS